MIAARRVSLSSLLKIGLCALVLTAPAMNACALTLDELASRRQEALAQMSEGAPRAQLAQLYDQAEGSLRAVEGFTAQLEAYRKTTERRTETRRQLLDQIAQLLRLKATPTVSQRERTLDPAALENLLELTRSERATLEGKLGSYELKLRTLALRPTELGKEKTALTARLASIDSERAGLMDVAIDPVTRARAAALEAEYTARQTELEALNLEQVNLGGDQEITNLRRELVLLNLERLSDRMTTLGELLIDRREATAADVQEKVDLSQADLAALSPELQDTAQENAALAEELSGLVEAQGETVRQRGEYAELRQALNSEFEISRQRLQIAGTSAVLGRVLVEKRRRLPRLNQLEAQSRHVASEVTRASLRRIELEERAAMPLPGERSLSESTASGAPKAPETTEAAPPESAEARRLRESRKSLISNLDANYAAYLRQLDATAGEIQKLIETVSSYTALLDQRLMWIPNTPPWSLGTLWDLLRATSALINAVNWGELSSGISQALVGNPLWIVLLVTGFGGLMLARRPALQRLSELARAQAGIETRRARDSLLAMGYIAVVALPGPFVAYGISRLLGFGAAGSSLVEGLSFTLRSVAILWAVAAWWSIALSADGLIGGHFAAPLQDVARTRRAWRRFARLFVPTYSLAINFDLLAGTSAQASISRLLFLLAMLALLVFGMWLDRRVLPLLRTLLGPSAGAISRLLPRLALLPPPVLLILLSAAGYHYTAVELSRYYVMSLELLALAIVFYRISLRWIEIAEYRTRCAQAMGGVIDGEPSHDEGDFQRLNAQARQVMRNVVGWSLALGLVGVWRTVLPALSFLDEVTLWTIAVSDAEGGSRLQPITIANLALALIIAGVTFAASANLPGVVEIGLLQRLRLKQGSRYALTSLMQYALIALGFSFALSTLGLRWSQVQWLVAALGVGLGFGLQEIFANFISGLILLFERPVRVGDRVTIGDLTGKVIRMRIRATTLRDVDNREIIVPNKAFITDRFLNWTLSDQVTRVGLSVGVAYGTDLARAMRLLQEIAEANPWVMRDPAPEISLAGFGDSAVNLELHAFAAELADRGKLRHDILLEIYRRFAEAGIDIPFPQREIHLKPPAASPPGQVSSD